MKQKQNAMQLQVQGMRGEKLEDRLMKYLKNERLSNSFMKMIKVCCTRILKFGAIYANKNLTFLYKFLDKYIR